MQRAERERPPVFPSCWFEVFWKKKSLKVFKAWFLYLSVRKQTVARPNIFDYSKACGGRCWYKVLLTLFFKTELIDGVIWYRLWNAPKWDAKVVSWLTYYSVLEWEKAILQIVFGTVIETALFSENQLNTLKWRILFCVKYREKEPFKSKASKAIFEQWTFCDWSNKCRKSLRKGITKCHQKIKGILSNVRESNIQRKQSVKSTNWC